MYKEYQRKKLAELFTLSEIDGAVYLSKAGHVTRVFKSVWAAYYWAFPPHELKTTYFGNFGFLDGEGAFLLPEPLTGTAWQPIKKELYQMAIKTAREQGRETVFQIWNGSDEIRCSIVCKPNGRSEHKVYDYKTIERRFTKKEMKQSKREMKKQLKELKAEWQRIRERVCLTGEEIIKAKMNGKKF